MQRKVYEIPHAKASGPYSAAVESDDFLFLSGQTAMNSQNTLTYYRDIKEETEACFTLLFDLLQQASLTSDDVIKVNVFLVDMADFTAMNQIYQQKFKPPYPARTCVAVRGLPLGAQVEIEMIAKRRRIPCDKRSDG